MREQLASQIFVVHASQHPPSLVHVGQNVIRQCWLAHASLDLLPAGDQYEVVESAIRSADRYYRVLSMQPNAPPNCAEQMSSAFKSVATAWMQQQRVQPSSMLALDGPA